MSDESDQVWESMSDELRRVRRWRRIKATGATAAVVALGLFLSRPLFQQGAVMEGVVEIEALEERRPEVVEGEAPQFAVLIYDGEGMRFELIKGEQLASREMEFSLQPVVMSLNDRFR